MKGQKLFLKKQSNYGFSGLGMGGAGDNAGGYLGGMREERSIVTTTVQAINAIQPNMHRIATFLPCGQTSIANVLKEQKKYVPRKYSFLNSYCK